MSEHRPPLLGEWILRRLLRTPDRDHILGDLSEEYAAAREAGTGRLKTDVWYWAQVRRSVGPTFRRALGLGNGRREYEIRRSPRPIQAAAFAPGDVFQSTRQIVRTFLRRPAFPLIVVVTLGLGIGITTATYALSYGVLLRPLPLPDGDRLVSIRHTRLMGEGEPEARGARTAPGAFMRYRDGSQLLESIVAMPTQRVHLTYGTPTEVTLAYPTPGFDDLVRLSPVLGRWISTEDMAEERWTGVLSHALWTTHFGRDPAVLGRTIPLNGQPVEVVGVAPPETAVILSGVDAWVTLPVSVRDPANLRFGGWNWTTVARLQPGVTLEELDRELNHLLATLPEAQPQHERAWNNWYVDFRVRPEVRFLLDQRVQYARGWILLLLGASLVTLLVALANVATVALVRSLDRAPDIAVRAALGGGRWGLIRYAALEAILLAGAAAAVGLGLAHLLVRGLATYAVDIIPRIEDVALDGPVATAAAVLFVVSMLVLVLVPAFRVPGDLAPALRGAEQGRSRGVRSAQGGLLAGQVAMAVVLVVFGGLMARTFWTLRTLDLGFAAEGLYTFQLQWPERADREEGKLAFFRDLQERIQGIPGVMAVSAAECVPLRCGIGQSVVADREGVEEEEQGDPPALTRSAIMPGYFTTLGVPILAGRDLTWEDVWTPAEGNNQDWINRVVINERAARLLYPGLDPVGRSVARRYGGEERLIVGVVRDVEIEGPVMTPWRSGLFAYRADPRFDGMQWVVRASVPLEQILPAIRETVWETDPTIPVENVADYEQLVAEATRDRMLILLLALVGAGVSLTLGLVGVYGALAHEVRRRRRELGIRTALGASRRELRGAVLRRGALLLSLGLAVGLAGAVASSRFLEAVVYGVSTLDLPAYVGAVALVMLLGLVASYLPALRASRADPMEVLRTE